MPEDECHIEGTGIDDLTLGAARQPSVELSAPGGAEVRGTDTRGPRSNVRHGEVRPSFQTALKELRQC